MKDIRSIYRNFLHWRSVLDRVYPIYMHILGLTDILQVSSKGYRILIDYGRGDLSTVCQVNEEYRSETFSDHYDILIDVGGNIGAFSILYESYFDDIYVYEPNPEVYPFLRMNLIRNGLQGKIKAYEKAVSGSSGQEILNVRRDSAPSGSTTIQGGGEAHRVESISINEVLNDKEAQDEIFVKIDCEGAEFGIFESISDENLEKISEVRMEFHKEAGEFEKIEEKLASKDFEVKVLEENENTGISKAIKK